jgi:hypothetical protein
MLFYSIDIIGGDLPFANASFSFHQSSPSNTTATTELLDVRNGQQLITQVTLSCNEENGWAVVSLSDLGAGIASGISALRIENSTSIVITWTGNTNMTLLSTATITEDIVAYSVGSSLYNQYDLRFYTFPMEFVSAPSPDSSPATSTPSNLPDSPSTTPVTTPSKVSSAGQISFCVAFVLSLAFF